MNFLRKLPIRSQLLIIAASVIFVTVLLLFTSYLKTADIVKNNSNSYTNDMFINIKESIAASCDSLNRIVTGTAYNPIVQDYILETDPLKKLETLKNLNKFLLNMVNLKDGIIDIVIIGTDGNSNDFSGGTDFCKNLQGVIPERVNAYYSQLTYANYGKIQKNCFIISSNIYSINKDKLLSNKIGTLFILVTPEAINNQNRIKSKKSNEKIYLLDQKLKVFSYNSDVEIGSSLEFLNDDILNQRETSRLNVNKEIYSVKSDKLPEINGYIVSVTPDKELIGDIIDLRQTQMIIFLLAIFILSIPFVIVTNNIIKPLKKIMSFMHSIKSGNLKNLEKRIDLQGYSEMSIMAKEFNSMMDEINELTHRLVETSSRLYESELEKKKFELAMLKSQINPHFLYNTLESIKGLAVREGITEIRDMAKALGKMFQYSVKGDDFVYLKKELDIVKSYIQIQQIRFRDRFIVNYNLQEEILECFVIKMILQPIIENAIFHGLEPKKDLGYLTIQGEIINTNELVLRIKDTGVGIDKDTLENIRIQLAGENNKYSGISEKNGIGIANVNSRIKFTYGNIYGCHIESVLYEYTEVTVKLPVRRE